MKRIQICLLSFLIATSSFFFLNAYGTNGSAFSVEQQFGMSFDQIKNAAAQGDPDAEYALGYMYYYGKGTPRDEMSAKMWIEKAAAQGQPQAVKAIQMLGLSKMPKEASSGPQDPINNPTVSTEAVTSTIDNSNHTADHISANGNGNAASAVQTNGPLNSQPTMQPAMQPSSLNSNSMDATSANSTATAVPTSTTPTSISNDTTSNDMQKSMSNDVTVAKISSTKEQMTSKHFSGSKVTINKLLHAPSNYYTLQLLGSHRESDLTSFVSSHNLQNKTAYFRSTAFKGKPWYVLVYGIYPTEEKAQAAIKQLPTGIRKMNPWIKSMKMVQQELEAEKKTG